MRFQILGILLLSNLSGYRCAEVLEIKPLRELQPCLSSRINPSKVLKYSDGTIEPVKVPFGGWASIQIVGHIAHILMSEVMGYNVTLLENAAQNSGQAVKFSAGCKNPEGTNCQDRDLMHPTVHFSLETWQYGSSIALALPADIQPTLLNVQGYNTFEAMYIWNEVARLASADKVSLDYFKSFDAKYFQPSKYFDSWEVMLNKVPLEFITKCSEMGDGSINDRYASQYTQVHVKVQIITRK